MNTISHIQCTREKRVSFMALKANQTRNQPQITNRKSDTNRNMTCAKKEPQKPPHKRNTCAKHQHKNRKHRTKERNTSRNRIHNYNSKYNPKYNPEYKYKRTAKQTQKKRITDRNRGGKSPASSSPQPASAHQAYR